MKIIPGVEPAVGRISNSSWRSIVTTRSKASARRDRGPGGRSSPRRPVPNQAASSHRIRGGGTIGGGAAALPPPGGRRDVPRPQPADQCPVFQSDHFSIVDRCSLFERRICSVLKRHRQLRYSLRPVVPRRWRSPDCLVSVLACGHVEHARWYASAGILHRLPG